LIETNISIQTFTATATINKAKITCNTFVFTFFPAIAPSGEASKLATTMISDGKNSTCPVDTFPVMAPIYEISAMAKEEAIVIRVGIFKTVSMIGTNKNVPPRQQYLPQFQQLMQVRRQAIC
jgi:hypothetical protein